MTTEKMKVYFFPKTKLGKWAVGFGISYFPLMMLWYPLSFIGLGGYPALLAGLAGGICALFAILKNGERSFLVYSMLVPFLFVFVFLFAELLGGH